MRRLHRLVEPFAGSAAITLACAAQRRFERYVLADALEPLCSLWNSICTNPIKIADEYERLWQLERALPIIAFYDIRAEFNQDSEPAKLLYLLARCVKNAVRFNPAGEFNQSPDKRRKGTHPERMRAELLGAYELLHGRCVVEHSDFMEMFAMAKQGDFFYLDPPYQGTSNGRDQRYISGVSLHPEL
jgi:DNA adenine methylase